MTITLDIIQTLGLAVCVYIVGRWIKSKVTLFAMSGGVGSGASFGPTLEALGAEGGTTIGVAAATFGLLLGSLTGGPVAERRGTSVRHVRRRRRAAHRPRVGS